MSPTIKLPPPDIGDVKMKELILYLSRHSLSDPKFGVTKLNKLLFYCDFESYRRWSKTVTGKKYIHLAEGPVPHCMLPIRSQMIKAKILAIAVEEYYGFPQERTVALREPDVSIFSPKEIDLFKEILETYKDYNATEISKKTHLFAGFRITSEKEPIDLKMILIGDRLPTDKEIQHGLSLQ